MRITLSRDTNLVVATDGTMSADVRPLARFDVSVIAERNGRRERGFGGGGGRFDTGWLFETDAAERYAREAVRTALVNLDGVEAPAGTMPVVLGPGWPGVLLHEAVGHGLEGDFNRKGTSAFAGRIGEKVASGLCTVVDDATLADRRGSLTVDDEGTPGQRTVLIEDGVLVGYMQDKHNARLMGVASTGNARRQSYAYLPMPRMTNTFMLAGASEPEEIIASVDKGVYAVSFGGGQVDITSGKFTFSATEAYLIEGGKLGPRDPRCHADGQRTGGDGTHIHGRQQPRTRHWRRHLRQGRPDRAGGRRPTEPEDRPDHGRRHGRVVSGMGQSALLPQTRPRPNWPRTSKAWSSKSWPKRSALGASTAAEVAVASNTGLSVGVRKGELETVEFTNDRGLRHHRLRRRAQGQCASTSDAGPRRDSRYGAGGGQHRQVHRRGSSATALADAAN